MGEDPRVQRCTRGFVYVANLCGEHTIGRDQGVNSLAVEDHGQGGFPLRQVGGLARSTCVAQVVDELREREGVIAKPLEEGDSLSIRPGDASREAGDKLTEPPGLQARR